MEENELMHHGIKGQKWGVRRYQNKDGTLTPKGRARLLEDARKYEAKANTSVANNYFARSRKARLQQKAKDARYEVKKSDLQKYRQKKQQETSNSSKSKSKSSDGKKSVKEMSTKELQDTVTRLQLEQRYSQLNPKKVSTGEKFINSIKKDVLAPAAKDVGKRVATQIMNDVVDQMMSKAKKKKS